MQAIDDFIETQKREIGYEHMNECNRINAWFDILKLIQAEFSRQRVECVSNENI